MAARLHHTNIVPVFGTGEQDGVHYYAMQFIRGQGLDRVLLELQRRDGSGAVVKNLTQDDFEILEDGKAQQIRSFAFEEITDRPQNGVATAELLAGAQARLVEDRTHAQPSAPAG